MRSDPFSGAGAPYSVGRSQAAHPRWWRDEWICDPRRGLKKTYSVGPGTDELDLRGSEWRRCAFGAQKAHLTISYAKAGDYPSSTFISCENPGTIDLVPTGWQSANTSAFLVPP